MKPGSSQIPSRVEQVGSATGMPKRARSDSSAPSSSGIKNPSAKKLRGPIKQDVESRTGRQGIQPRSYAEASTIRMAVFPESYPESGIQEEQLLGLQAVLLSGMKPLSSGLFPQFRDCRMEASVVVFTCVDAESRSWLEGAVEAQGIWNGSRWQCKEAKKVLNMERVIMRVPPFYKNAKVGRSDGGVLSHIEKFNGISTVDWRVINAKQEEAGRRILVISITEKDHGKLK